MTKRIAVLAFAAAVALPATPAAAAGECIGWFTTPRECAEQLLEAAGPRVDCVRLGHTDIVCLPPAG